MLRTPRTEEEIQREIALLEEYMPRVPRNDFFGGNNWDKIEMEIRVLKGELDEEEINAIEDMDVSSDAYNALQWMEGYEVDCPPAASWESLAGVKKPAEPEPKKPKARKAKAKKRR
jgi:hypothetical protein